jgi:hypothetical protein
MNNKPTKVLATTLVISLLVVSVVSVMVPMDIALSTSAIGGIGFESLDTPTKPCNVEICTGLDWSR